MKLPWVSRERLEEAQRIANEAVDKHFALALKYDALVDRLLSLKMAGAVEVPKPIIATPEQIARVRLQDVDELADLIGAKAGKNLTLRAIMLSQLRADRASGRSDDEIRADIESGVSGIGVPE